MSFNVHKSFHYFLILFFSKQSTIVGLSQRSLGVSYTNCIPASCFFPWSSTSQTFLQAVNIFRSSSGCQIFYSLLQVSWQDTCSAWCTVDLHMHPSTRLLKSDAVFCTDSTTSLTPDMCAQGDGRRGSLEDGYQTANEQQCGIWSQPCRCNLE